MDRSSTGGFRQISEETVFEGKIIRVAVGEFVSPAGATVVRELVRHPGAVSVVPIVDDHVVMVRQYRAAIGADLLETYWKSCRSTRFSYFNNRKSGNKRIR